MSTQFYLKVPLVRRNGVGNGKVTFTWQRKLSQSLDILLQPDVMVVDEYGREYTRMEFAEEVAKGKEE